MAAETSTVVLLDSNAFVIPDVSPAAVPVALVATKAEGVSKFGEVKTGELEKTAAPVPVSSAKAAASCADVNEPNDAAKLPVPEPVTMPVKVIV